MKFAALCLIAAAVVLQPQEISYTTQPRVIRKVQCEYTKEARKAKLQGTVVSALVGVDGRPSDIQLVRRLDKGLDEKATRDRPLSSVSRRGFLTLLRTSLYHQTSR
jgi:hypothetical protein